MKRGEEGFLRQHERKQAWDRRTRPLNATLRVFYARLLQLASSPQEFENSPLPAALGGGII
jgi:hypothetical protein